MTETKNKPWVYWTVASLLIVVGLIAMASSMVMNWRFGWGLAAALVCTPPRLVPAGFFRVNLLVVLGLVIGLRSHVDAHGDGHGPPEPRFFSHS